MPCTSKPSQASSRLLILLLLLAATFTLNTQPLVLQGANVVDGKSDQPINNVTVIIEDGKISKIIKDGEGIPRGGKVIDLNGKYIMPGLIDAHVHIRSFAAAETALRSGVTTVRSMGVAHFTDVGMRELARQGTLQTPEFLAAGYHVRPTPDDGFFLNFPELSHLMKDGIKGEAAIRKMAEALISRKVDWIKTNATARAGLPQTDPREPYYTEEELKILVQVGAEYGIPVAAHAHGDEGGRAAVLAGVKSIEHGTYLSEETLKLMLERGTYLVPTIAIVNDLVEPGGDYDQPLLEVRGRHMLPRIRETASKAYKMGVKIIASTDTGYNPNSVMRLGLELEELVGIGMSNAEAIAAATSAAAEFLEIDNHTGQIAEGMDADLLILERNPLQHIKAIHDPLMVVNNGKIVVNRVEWTKE
ncbi:MAG: amidohydrolase family protein [Saprospiraceae bacterium]|nr:amidohydrolase family protein [Saprospiraceae bacterium]